MKKKLLTLLTFLTITCGVVFAQQQQLSWAGWMIPPRENWAESTPNAMTTPPPIIDNGNIWFSLAEPHEGSIILLTDNKSLFKVGRIIRRTQQNEELPYYLGMYGSYAEIGEWKELPEGTLLWVCDYADIAMTFKVDQINSTHINEYITKGGKYGGSRSYFFFPCKVMVRQRTYDGDSLPGIES